MRITQLLAGNGFIVVNKGIARMFGLDTAILLGELCAEYEYWENNNRLLENAWFYSTIENIQENTSLSAFQQRKAIEKLESVEVLNTKLIGMPAKKYFSLDINKLNSLMLSNLTTCSKETSLQGVKKLNRKELNNLTPSSEIIKQHDVKLINANNNKGISNKRKSNKELVIKDIAKEPKDLVSKETLLSVIQEYSSGELLETLKSFIEMRKTARKPLTVKGLKMVLNDLNKLTDDEYIKIKIVEESIKKNWLTFYQLKDNTNNTNTTGNSYKPKKPTTDDFARALEEMKAEAAEGERA